MDLVLSIVFLTLLSKQLVTSSCPQNGSRPILRGTPERRIHPGAILKAECSRPLPFRPGQSPQITWSIYKKEWGHLQYTLVPPHDRKLEIFSDPKCSGTTTSRLTLYVRERLNRATLACFAHDTSGQPQKCGAKDWSCVQSQPIKVFIPPPLTRCAFQFGIFGGLLGGWLAILLPLMVMGVWWGTKSLPATPEVLLEGKLPPFTLSPSISW
ncbi:hypothetical protein RRG08_042318 [Elysia crispata]|uniref:Ig-like domain-containing protein n=1 Tax=Elysia crispata TaxID=231223 RepID=A0AAE1DHN4_9GAST|nr:hypothetical protein RRG08_042318 [Elysia crispata]